MLTRRCPPPASRAQALLFCGLAAVGVATSPGCRLPGRDAALSKSVVTCRQLAQQGTSAMERNDWVLAENLFAEAVKTCPNDPEAHQRYAEALWHRGDRAKALAEMETAQRQAGDDDTLLVRSGEMRLALGQFGPARKDAEQALDLNPRSAAGWLLQGRISRATGQQRQALAAFHRALTYAPDSRDALLELAETHRELNEPERALMKLQSLAETYPAGEEPASVLYLQGLALSALGRHSDAVMTLRTARHRGPPAADLLARLADAEMRSGDPTAARQDAEAALGMDPGNVLARAIVGQAGIAQGGRPGELR